MTTKKKNEEKETGLQKKAKKPVVKKSSLKKKTSKKVTGDAEISLGNDSTVTVDTSEISDKNVEQEQKPATNSQIVESYSESDGMVEVSKKTPVSTKSSNKKGRIAKQPKEVEVSVSQKQTISAQNEPEEKEKEQPQAEQNDEAKTDEIITVKNPESSDNLDEHNVNEVSAVSKTSNADTKDNAVTDESKNESNSIVPDNQNSMNHDRQQQRLKPIPPIPHIRIDTIVDLINAPHRQILLSDQQIQSLSLEDATKRFRWIEGMLAWILNYDIVISDTNIWLELLVGHTSNHSDPKVNARLLFERQLEFISKLVRYRGGRFMMMSETYEEIDRFATQQAPANYKDADFTDEAVCRNTAARLAKRLILSQQRENRLRIEGIGAESHHSAFADPAIIRKTVELFSVGKKVLLLTNDASVAIRSIGMCDDLQRHNNIDDTTWENVYVPLRPMVITMDDLKVLDSYTRQYYFLQMAAGKQWMEDVPRQMEIHNVEHLSLWMEGFRPGDKYAESHNSDQQKQNNNQQKQNNNSQKQGGNQQKQQKQGNHNAQQKQNAQNKKSSQVSNALPANVSQSDQPYQSSQVDQQSNAQPSNNESQQDLQSSNSQKQGSALHAKKGNQTSSNQSGETQEHVQNEDAQEEQKTTNGNSTNANNQNKRRNRRKPTNNANSVKENTIVPTSEPTTADNATQLVLTDNENATTENGVDEKIDKVSSPKRSYRRRPQRKKES